MQASPVRSHPSGTLTRTNGGAPRKSTCTVRSCVRAPSIRGWWPAAADASSLSRVAQPGRYLGVEEDWREIARKAPLIQQNDLYTLRLRTLDEPAGPPAPTRPPIH